MADAATEEGDRDTDATAARSIDGRVFALARPLPAVLLCHRCTVADLPFALSSELEEAPGLIGQERAVEAINLAMRMRRKGYNAYALGPSGTGRHSLIEALLRKQAESEPTPLDWCYVNNFADPQKPRRLRLPAGRGAGLAAAMKRLVEELRVALPAGFEHEEYRAQREIIEQEFKGRHEQAFGALQARADIALLRTPSGLALAPKRDGKALWQEQFGELPPAERENIQREIAAIQGELAGFLGARFGLNQPLSLNTSLVFEQSYSSVDGDSASAAELFALLPALAEAPITQALAVTGSVDQRGQIQTIGGVNEKIEGFFDACRGIGLISNRAS